MAIETVTTYANGPKESPRAAKPSSEVRTPTQTAKAASPDLGNIPPSSTLQSAPSPSGTMSPTASAPMGGIPAGIPPLPGSDFIARLQQLAPQYLSPQSSSISIMTSNGQIVPSHQVNLNQEFTNGALSGAALLPTGLPPMGHIA